METNKITMSFHTPHGQNWKSARVLPAKVKEFMSQLYDAFSSAKGASFGFSEEGKIFANIADALDWLDLDTSLSEALLKG